MSIEIEHIPVPATTQEKMTVICELCGQKSHSCGGEGHDWAPRFGVEKTGLFIAEGSSYPEGGSGIYTTTEICLNCFKKTIIPKLEELGITFRTAEWDW